MTLPLCIRILLIGLLWSALFLTTPPAANAGVIFGPPMYMGLSSGLVGYWTFDGADTSINGSGVLTTYDRSGNGITASTTGAANTRPTKVIGKIGQALTFDGANDFLDAGDPSILRLTGSMTISAWINSPFTFADDNDILSKDDNISAGGWHLGTTIDAVVRQSQFRVTRAACDGVGGIQYGNTTLQKNMWYHIVGVYNASAQTMDTYLNGVKDSTTLTSADGVPSSQCAVAGTNVNIGQRSSTDKWVSGPIDDVRIYNRALSTDEVKRLYKIGSTLRFGAPNTTGSLSQGLVAYWPMDGNDTPLNNSSIRTALDRAGNNYHAKSGSAAVSPVKAPGKMGQALDFDGSNDTMLAAAASLGQLNALTVSAWIYPRDFNPAINVAGILERVSGAIEWGFALDDTDVVDGLTFLLNCSVSPMQVFAANSITLNTWQHVVVTWTGGCTAASVTFYVDGTVKTRSGADGGGSPPNDNGLAFEISSDSSDTYYMNGPIDDLRLYNRVLTTDEIKRLYKMGSTLKQGAPNSTGSLSQGLVGHWTFDGTDVALNSSGKLTVYDRSGSGSSASSTRQGAAGISPLSTSGKIGQGVNFTQTSNQYLDAGHPSAYVSMPKLTASAWVYPRSAGLSNNGIFLAKGYGIQASLTEGWVTGFDSFDGVRNEFYFEVDCPTTNLKVRSSQNVFTYNQWQFMTITWDDSQNASGVHLYRNGVEVSYDLQTDGGGAPQDDTSQDLIIGNTNDGIETFDGTIDDVRLYNRILSTDEIKRLYNLGR